MIEEPYRWVEAIANRREYIEAQRELDEFDTEYRKCVDLAFRLMFKKYSRS